MERNDFPVSPSVPAFGYSSSLSSATHSPYRTWSVLYLNNKFTLFPNLATLGFFYRCIKFLFPAANNLSAKLMRNCFNKPDLFYFIHFLKTLFSINNCAICFSVQFSHSVVSDSLWPHEPQHARPPCPSPMSTVYLTHVQWVTDAIQASHPLSSPSPPVLNLTLLSSGYFQMSQLFASGGQSIGVSASTSVLPMNTQDWPPLGGTGWISLQSKRLSSVFSNTTVQKHHFFGAQLSL